MGEQKQSLQDIKRKIKKVNRNVRHKKVSIVSFDDRKVIIYRRVFELLKENLLM